MHGDSSHCIQFFIAYACDLTLSTEPSAVQSPSTTHSCDSHTVCASAASLLNGLRTR